MDEQVKVSLRFYQSLGEWIAAIYVADQTEFTKGKYFDIGAGRSREAAKDWFFKRNPKLKPENCLFQEIT